MRSDIGQQYNNRKHILYMSKYSQGNTSVALGQVYDI